MHVLTGIQLLGRRAKIPAFGWYARDTMILETQWQPMPAYSPTNVRPSGSNLCHGSEKPRGDYVQRPKGTVEDDNEVRKASDRSKQLY